jgi:VanZ family protein
MTDAPMYSNASPAASGWSNRILIAAVAGILFLTLYPFRFTFPWHPADHVFPYFLPGKGKAAGLPDAFLNVLLFVPFGFGLAEKLRERGKSWAATLGLTLAAGALLSYAIEFLQIYIPARDSGWEDVLTNSTGSTFGFLLFELCGAAVLRFLSACERTLAMFLTLRRAPLILLAYFALWFAISIPLQKESRLSNWSSDALLVVGNAASGRLVSAWKGEIFRLEFWDHALPREFARRLTSGGPRDAFDTTSLAAYEFSGSAPFRDQGHLLPDLSWVPRAPDLTDSKAVALDGKSWLVSRGPVSALLGDFQKTRQFSIRVLCKPAQVDGIDARIVSLSRTSEPANLEIRQEGANLVFWFRNPLSVKRSRLAWYVSDVFAVQRPRDILFSYDGSNLSLYIDGREERRTYRLSPGTGLAQMVHRIKSSELEGYRDIFYALVFFPAGCLLGYAWRNLIAQPVGRLLFVVFGFLAPAVLLEIVLARVSGRSMSLESIVLAALLTVGGSLWVDADPAALDTSWNSSTRNLAK